MFPILDFDPVPKSAAAYSCSGTVLAFDNANNAARKAPTLLMEGGLVGQLARVRYGPRSLRVFGTDTDDVERVAELVRDLHPPIAAGLQLAVQTLENLPGGNCRFFHVACPVRQFPISSGSERSRSMSCGSDPMTNSNALLMSFSNSDMDALTPFLQTVQLKSQRRLRPAPQEPLDTA